MVNRNKNEDIQDVEDVVSEVQDVEHVDSEVQNVEHVDNEIQNVEDIENVENVDNEAEDIVRGEKESPYDFSLLCVGYTFQNWNDVDSFFNAYGRQFGFAVIKKRVEHGNDGIIKHRSFGCEFGGTYSPKKIINVNAHREGKSKRQGCEWHINLSFPKGATCIKVTTFVNTHNHELHPEICKFSPKFREFGKDAMNEIEFYTKNGNLSITMQRRLLKARYPNITFLDSDLANAIQHFKTESREFEATDAARLFTLLTEKRSEELGWVVEFELDADNRLSRLFWMTPDQVSLWLEYHDVVLNDNTAKTNRYQMPLSLFLIVNNNTRSRLVAQALISDKTAESYRWILQCTLKATGAEPLVFVTDADPAMDSALTQVYGTTKSLHCIFHINQNLPKNLKSVLGSTYDQFIKEFYHCRNTLDESLFEMRWHNLLQKFPLAVNYLNRVLYPSRCSWACAFTSKVFTAGIQTTSRVEGYNNIIKQALHSKSSLFDVFKALDSRLEKEAEWNRFFEYQTLSSCLGIASVGSEIFPAIDREMSEFLTPHILSVERTEIAQCLYYNAVLVDLAIVYSYSDYEYKAIL